MDALSLALRELESAREAYDEALSRRLTSPTEADTRLVDAQAAVATHSGGERAMVLDDLPPCNPGSPEPMVVGDGRSVRLSYITDLPPDTRRITVTFTGVDSMTFGGPSDETLHGHRLWDKGLELYFWHEVIASRWIETRAHEDAVHDQHRPAVFARLRHFIVTFHDETFECLARDVMLGPPMLETAVDEVETVGMPGGPGSH